MTQQYTQRPSKSVVGTKAIGMSVYNSNIYLLSTDAKQIINTENKQRIIILVVVLSSVITKQILSWISISMEVSLDSQ